MTKPKRYFTLFARRDNYIPTRVGKIKSRGNTKFWQGNEKSRSVEMHSYSGKLLFNKNQSHPNHMKSHIWGFITENENIYKKTYCKYL